MFKQNFYTRLLKRGRFQKRVPIFNLVAIQQQYSTEIFTARAKTPKTLKEIPGPTKWQFFRALAPGGKYHHVHFLNMIKMLREEYGDIAFIPGSFGKANIIILHNPDDIEKVYRNDDVWPAKTFLQTVLYHRKNYRKKDFQNVFGLLPTNDKDWSNFRSLVNPVLMQPKAVINYMDHMSQVSDEFVQRIKGLRDTKSLEVPANFVKHINYWSLESATLVVLNKSFGLLKDKPISQDVQIFLHHLEKFFEIFGDFEMEPPIWKIIATPKFKTLLKSLDVITEFVDKNQEETLNKLTNENAKDETIAVQSMLGKLMKIDPKVARVMALDALFGGVVRASTGFTGILLCLAKFPEKQAKLREEIMRILHSKSSSLTEENMKNMPYLRACLKESLRMYPVGFGAPRTLTKDIVLSDYLIPKGTVAMLSNFLLLRDPAFFPKPNEFIPERWMRQYKKSTEFIGEKSHAFAYFPFGFGARSCAGQRIVNLQMEIGIINLIRNFQIEFNHSVENIFKPVSVFVPAKPLLFKFTDL